MATVRPARGADAGAIAAVAIAAGQDEEWSGSDPAYVAYLVAHGEMVVAEHDGAVAGFGATLRIGDGPAAISMLCDLFVHPAVHGLGLGRCMLDALWPDAAAPRRMTFSSLHAHALPLYTRYGLDAWWPLLYLAGDPAALAVPPGWSVRAATAEQVAGLEQGWTGVSRLAEHRAFAGRPSGAPVVVSREGRDRGAGTVAGAGGEFGLARLALACDASAAEAAAAVLVTLASLRPAAGRTTTRDRTNPAARCQSAGATTARVCLPAPHPAVRQLLAAGWRCQENDLFMATEPDLLDPRRAVPSPAMA